MMNHLVSLIVEIEFIVNVNMNILCSLPFIGGQVDGKRPGSDSLISSMGYSCAFKSLFHMWNLSVSLIENM